VPPSAEFQSSGELSLLKNISLGKIGETAPKEEIGSQKRRPAARFELELGGIFRTTLAVEKCYRNVLAKAVQARHRTAFAVWYESTRVIPRPAMAASIAAPRC
jgi:hypothetical protein